MIARYISIKIGDRVLTLQGIDTVNLAQVSDLPNTLMIESNSDLILRYKLVITIELIEQKISLRK